MHSNIWVYTARTYRLIYVPLFHTIFNIRTSFTRIFLALLLIRYMYMYVLFFF